MRKTSPTFPSVQRRRRSSLSTFFRSGPFEYAANPSVPFSNPGWGDRHFFVNRGPNGKGGNGSLDVSPETGEAGRNERRVFENEEDVHYQVFCDEAGERPELTHLWASGPKTKNAGDKEKFHYNSQRKEATLFGVYKSPFGDWAPHQVYATFTTDGKTGTLSSLRYAGTELAGSSEAREASLREDIVSKFLGIREGGKIDLYRTCVNFAEKPAGRGLIRPVSPCEIFRNCMRPARTAHPAGIQHN